MRYAFRLNGQSQFYDGDLTQRLLDVIRIDFGLMGTKEGCQEGECGACLVFIDGDIYNACLVPMGNVISRSVETIEHFSTTDAYARIANAYQTQGAVQCGYCTPGMVMATHALLKSGKGHTLEEVQLELSGNLCRCTGYQSIFGAIQILVKEDKCDD